MTSLVTRSVDLDGDGPEDATIGAIIHAERPGAMICSVEADLREFLQGPYWRLIRNRLEKKPEEFDRIQAAYRQIVVEGSEAVADSVIESLVVQWLENEQDKAQRIKWRVLLLEVAVKTRRYQAGLHQLHEIAAEMAVLNPPSLSPKTVLAVLSIFNQYAFGVGNQEGRELLQNLCNRLATEVLQVPIISYLKDKALPEGCDLSELIKWCEALVGFRQGLGHMDDYVVWLHQLCRLQADQLLGDDAPEYDLRLSAALNRLRLAQASAIRARDRAAWDKVFKIYSQQVPFLIDMLERQEQHIFIAWCQISILYFGELGRSHYPEQQDWGNDYHNYVRSAHAFGDVLVERIRTNGETEEWIDFGCDLLSEALLHGATLTIEYAEIKGFDLAPEFLDRIRLVSESVFKLIQDGGYVPTSLACAAMESERAVMTMLHKLSLVTGVATEPVSPEVLGVTTYRLKSRSVAEDEYLQIMDKIESAINRYRQLGMLSVEMIRVFAWACCNRLDLTNTDLVETSVAFNRIVDDVILIEDGKRAAFGEPVILLPFLVRMFDKWLVNSPDAETLWKRLRAGYSSCSDRVFDGLVEMIRG